MDRLAFLSSLVIVALSPAVDAAGQKPTGSQPRAPSESFETRLAAGREKVRTPDIRVTGDGVRVLEALTADAPQLAEPWYWLGVGYGFQSEDEKEEKAFQKYLELAPDGPFAKEVRDYFEALKRGRREADEEARLRTESAKKTPEASRKDVYALGTSTSDPDIAFACWRMLARPRLLGPVSDTMASRAVARKLADDYALRFAKAPRVALIKAWRRVYDELSEPQHLQLTTVEHLQREVEEALAKSDRLTARERFLRMDQILRGPVLRNVPTADPQRVWIEANRYRVMDP